MEATDLLQCAACKKIGYVQFGDNLPLHQLRVEERTNLQNHARALQVKIEVGTRRLTSQHILQYLPIAQQFGSPFLRVVIDDNDYHPNEDEIVCAIETLLPHLQKRKVILAIENHDRFPARTLERIIKRTDEQWVGICLDTANSIGAGEGVEHVLNVLGPYTVNLHIKDILINRLPHKMGFLVEGCAAGLGLLNIPWLVDTLKQYSRCETATLEVWSQPESTIDETLAKEKTWVQSSIDYLKTILT